MNTPAVSQMKGLVDTAQGLLDRQIFFFLAQNKEFWQLMDRAHKEGEKKGFTKLEDLAD
jgi:hypothetical protein